MKNSREYKQLKEAMELIHELKIPEHLQEKALVHLLRGATAPESAAEGADTDVPDGSEGGSGTKALRAFVRQYGPKGAVAEIPALLWWVSKNEKTKQVNEDDIVALYRRAGIRPPKRVDQSIRDLASKKYARLKWVAGKPGYAELSRAGEDFVLYELIEKATQNG